MATLQDKLIRHQIYLEGLKAGQLLAFAPVLKDIEAEVKRSLNGLDFESMGEFTRAALIKFVNTLRNSLIHRYSKYTSSMLIFLRRFMRYEFEMSRTIFANDYEQRGKIMPTTKDDDELLALWWPRTKNAVLPANGIVLEKFVTALGTAAANLIAARVAQAAASHESVKDTLAAIVGTEGYSKRLTAQARAVLATAMQSVSAQSQAAFAAILGFDEYEWISVLDDRTSNICKSRSGKRFKYGSGPLPPAHPNCRSHIEPVVEGATIANPSFKDWVASQPTNVRKDMFGSRTVADKFEGAAVITTLDEFGNKTSLIIA